MSLMSEIPFENLTDDEVLFFIRIKGKESYFKMFYPDHFLKRFKKVQQFRTISEYTRDADVFIDIKKYKYSDISTADKELIAKVLPADEIIKRCRGLREISYAESKDLIYRTAKFFIEFYPKTKTKYIVAGCVDNYVMDIMHRMAVYFGIKLLSITDFFLYPDYKLVTVTGEHNQFHNPSSDEVNKVYSALTAKRKSPLAISKKQALKNALYDFGSYYARYVTRYVWKYKICGALGYEYRFSKFLKKFHNPLQLLSIFYFKPLTAEETAKISADRNHYAYLPLHYFPEATIDYWTDRPENADYYHHLFDVIKYFEERGVNLLIKEHPAFFLSRTLDIYNKFREYKNVRLISPFVKTQDILESVDNVIVWNGSTGVESIMLDKKVYITTGSYYATSSFKTFKMFGEATSFSADEKRQLINRVLETSIPTAETGH